MKNYSDYGIDLKSNKTSGEVNCICPKCSHTRKKKTDKCLSVNLDKQVWYCFNCGWKGALVIEKPKPIEYVKPVWRNNTELSVNAVKWFESRGISQNTLVKMKITEGLEWMPKHNKEVNTIQFNYFDGEDLINTKFRTGDKVFKMVKDAEKIPYNINSIQDHNEVFIVEGEIDVLTMIESGIESVISVPNGANLGNNNLDYLDKYIDKLITKKIIIATDNDSAGRSLKNDLADRFGHYNCFWLDLGQYKDLNEVLINEGINGVLSLKAKEFEIVGSIGVEYYWDEVFDLYQNGLDNGCKIKDGVLDDYLSFVKGYITTITGIPGHGKSEYLDHITTHLIVNHNWKGAFYSPENKPTKLHLSKLVRKITGKGWYGQDKINDNDLANCLNWLYEKIWFIKPPKGFDLENILNSVKELKERKNIDFFVIDAWNKLEHKFDQNETKYIGESLDKIAVFCEENNVHCFLVAHPKKISKNKDGIFEIPNLYDIAGSANFYNKSDNGITVYRSFDQSNPDYSWSTVFIQKVKFNHWGKIGMAEYDFQKHNLRYRKKGTYENNESMLISTKPLQSNENFDKEPF